MSQKIICPECKAEFLMEQGLKSHFDELKQSIIDGVKKQEQENKKERVE